MLEDFGSESLCVYMQQVGLCVHVSVCVSLGRSACETRPRVRMPMFVHDPVCGRVFCSFFFLLPSLRGLCPLEGVLASQLRERLENKIWSRRRRSNWDKDDRERSRRGRARDWETTGEGCKAAPPCSVCCFEPCSRCLCIANIANTTL